MGRDTCSFGERPINEMVAYTVRRVGRNVKISDPYLVVNSTVVVGDSMR